MREVNLAVFIFVMISGVIGRSAVEPLPEAAFLQLKRTKGAVRPPE